jgi:hypothetical protein
MSSMILNHASEEGAGDAKSAAPSSGGSGGKTSLVGNLKSMLAKKDKAAA